VHLTCDRIGGLGGERLVGLLVFWFRRMNVRPRVVLIAGGGKQRGGDVDAERPVGYSPGRPGLLTFG
jgi:hypothetical protein